MKDLVFEYKKIGDLKPAPYNPRQDLQPTDKEYVKLKNSIEKFGLVEPVVYNERTGIVVGGHQRLKVIKDLGYSEVPVVVVDLHEAEEKALNIALNQISGDWNYELLKQVLEDINNSPVEALLTGFDLSEINSILDEPIDLNSAITDEKYTMKVDIPQYEIKGEKPNLSELVNKDKFKELISDIEKAEIPKDEKDFLKVAATRHFVFNYANIAEYYAHAPKEVQILMEQSALVIIDFDDAIKYGFARISKEVSEMYEEDIEHEE